MADLTAQRRGRLSGMLIPFRAAGVLESDSSYSEADPCIESVVPQQDTEAVCNGSGTPPSATHQLRVRAAKAGMPGLDDRAASWIWRTETDDDYRGWEVPQTISAWEIVDWYTGSGTYLQQHDAVTRPDDGLVFVSHAEISGGGYGVYCHRKAATASSWTLSIVDVASSATSIDTHPAIVALPDGRLLCFYWVVEPGGDFQIQVKQSSNGGQTWTLWSRYALPTPLEKNSAGSSNSGYSTARRIRAVYHRGAICLVAALEDADSSLTSGARERIGQWASSDLGVTLQPVFAVDEASTAAYLGRYPDLAVSNDRIVMSWAKSVTPKTTVVSLGSAWQPFGVLTPVEVTGDLIADVDGSQHITNGDSAMVADPDGTLYVYERRDNTATASSTGQIVCTRSVDGGATWEGLGQSTHADEPNHAPIWWGGDTATHPTQMAYTVQRSRVVMVHSWDADPATNDESTAVAYLGGWSSLPLPAFIATYESAARVGWTHTYLPIERPDDLPEWTATGAATDALTSDGLNIVTSATARYFSGTAGAVDLAEGFIGECELIVVSGAYSASNIIFSMRLANGTAEYKILLRFGTNGFVVFDPHAASGTGLAKDTVAIDCTAGVAVRVALTEAGYVVGYRAAGVGPDRLWTVVDGTLADAASYTTASSNSQVEWGHPAGTGESNWLRVNYVANEYTGLQLLDASYPGDLPGHPASYTPTHLDVGVHADLADGPAAVADEWLISAGARYPIEAALAGDRRSRTRRNVWRSADETQQQIALPLLDTDGSADHFVLSPLMGLVVLGTGGSIRTGSVKAQTSGGGYSTLFSFDAASGLEIDATRSGNTVLPDTPAGGDEPYLLTNEFAGGALSLSASVTRTIVRHTAGKGGDSGHRFRMTLSGVNDGSDPTSLSARGIVPDGFVILWDAQDSDAYDGLMLEIDAQDTPGGYFQASLIAFGHVEVFGTPPSWGRAYEREENVDRDVLRDGSDVVRVNGPSRRIFETSWTDEVVQARAFADRTPDHVNATTDSGYTGAASVQDTLHQVEGILQQQQGPKWPVIYLPNIQITSTAGERMLNRRRDFAHVALPKSIRHETVQGQPNRDEVARMSVIALYELP